MSSVCGFYKFISLQDTEALAAELRRWGRELGLKGTVLLAAEGINGSVAGDDQALESWQDRLQGLPELEDLGFWRTTTGGILPFHKFKVKVRGEIIPLCQGGICPNEHRLQYLDALAWNELLDDPEALVIDVRNAFEHRVGRFPGAVDPGLASFAEFAEWAEREHRPPPSRIGMYCTGGIRCEKAAPLWQELHGAEVFQLQGGIISYLQSIAPERNRWQGECFVFDYRVSLDSQLRPGSHALCYGCGEPLTPAEREDSRYEFGVSCPYCHGQRSAEAIAASRERRRQIELARQRQATASGTLIDHCAASVPSHGR